MRHCLKIVDNKFVGSKSRAGVDNLVISRDTVFVGSHSLVRRISGKTRHIDHDGVLNCRIVAVLVEGNRALKGRSLTNVDNVFFFMRFVVGAGYSGVVAGNQHAAVCAGIISIGLYGNSSITNLKRLISGRFSVGIGELFTENGQGAEFLHSGCARSSISNL